MIANDLLVEVLARMQGSPAVLDNVDRIRREHRTMIARDQAPSVYLVDGDENPTPITWKKCDKWYELMFTVRIFVRDDQGYTAADAIRTRVYAAIDPVVPYAHNAQLARGRVTSEQEIADADVICLDCEFTFRYLSNEWGA